MFGKVLAVCVAAVVLWNGVGASAGDEAPPATAPAARTEQVKGKLFDCQEGDGFAFILVSTDDDKVTRFNVTAGVRIVDQDGKEIKDRLKSPLIVKDIGVIVSREVRDGARKTTQVKFLVKQ
jgi:hypothetical protein